MQRCQVFPNDFTDLAEKTEKPTPGYEEEEKRGWSLLDILIIMNMDVENQSHEQIWSILTLLRSGSAEKNAKISSFCSQNFIK